MNKLSYHEGNNHIVLQGGISDGVWNEDTTQHYIKSLVCAGYIGHDKRTEETDKQVENALRKTGLGDRGIAIWLTSTSGRHLAESIGSAEWQDAIKDYTKNAFMEVTIWSHPDHEGTLGSSNRIRERIKEAFETKNEHETKVCRSCQRDGCWCGQLSECLDCHGRGKIPCKECRKYLCL